MTEKDKFNKRGPKSASSGKPKKDGSRSGEATRKSAPAAPVVAGERPPERISKIMARAGVASRRDAERMIFEGRVKLNGKVLESPAINVTLADKIEVDGAEIRGIERTRMWIYHKPAGLVTTNSDPEGRPTVFERLPKELPRVISIGRLDINTEGLLLLTNDGGLARVLELPATGWLRRYRVRAHGKIEQADLDKLKDGIAVEGVLYGGIDATLDRVQGSNVWITMGLREGKNREIKNVLGALGLEVGRLIRISYGPFQLGEIPEGQVMEVRGRTLRDQLGPRLVEEAGANFDAPLYNEKPGDADDKAEAAAKPRREKLKPADKRERGRDKLDTKRDRDAEKPEAKPVERRPRSSNVWMAPGARPVGPKAKKKAEDRARQDERRDARKAGRTSEGPRSESSRGKPYEGRSEGRGDDRPSKGPAGGRGKPFEGRGPKGSGKGPAGGRGKPSGASRGGPSGARPRGDGGNKGRRG